jgi:hypothetical protein
MMCFMNKYVMASIGSLSVIAVAAAHVEFVQHPLTADVEAAAIVLASASTSAQIVVAHSTLDGVEYVVIPPERLPAPFVSQF